MVDISASGVYGESVLELIKSSTFDRWLGGLRDKKALGRIQSRLDRLAAGNPGDVKAVGSGVSELRIDYGPGYRVYFMRRGKLIVVLLCGGDKSTQSQDIARAHAVAEQWKGTL